MTKALALAQAQLAAGKSRQQIADEIDMSRTAVSRWLSGQYGAGTDAIDARVRQAYDRRICPDDGGEKTPEHCRRIALRPRPNGFPDAESRWLCCQTCAHKPTDPLLTGASK